MPSINNGKERFILIIEDDPGISALETQRLEPLGVPILRVSTPEETFSALKAGRPELMLVDYSLSGITALELLEKIKENSLEIPPFMLVTGRGDERVAVDAMKAGALDYIVKDGAFLDNLLPAVRKALEKTELQRKLAKAQADERKSLRLYNFLAQINQAVVRERDRNKLLAAICEIAVSAGGMKTAWAAQPDKDIGRLTYVCSAGAPAERFRGLRVDTGGGQYSAGPMGQAYLTKKTTEVPEIAEAQQLAPWHGQARRDGVRSAAAVPFLVRGEVDAVLSLYSAEPGFFTPEEMRLLTEIQADVSLGLETMLIEKERAAAQAALERTSAQLSHVLAVNPVILFRLRAIGGRMITEWISGNVQDLLGCDAAEMLNPAWFGENLHPQDRARVLAVRAELRTRGGAVMDFRVRKKGADYIWVHGQLKMISAEEAIGSWTDITQLKQSEERFHEMFREAPAGYQSLDGEGNLLAVNSAWCRTFGREEKEVLGRNFGEFLTPGSREAFAVKFPKLKEAGIVEGVEFDAARPDGTTRRISVSGRVARNQDGSFRQTHCVFTDITDTWRAREQTDLLGQAVRSSFNEVYIFDPEDFHFLFSNTGAIKNLGYTQEALQKMTPWDINPEFTEQSFREKVAPILAGREKLLVFETVHRRKDGSTYPVEVRLQLVETGKKRVFLAVINDITERKKNEKIILEMAAMQRVESLGLLAGGIAHDFNNMLTGIMANISLLSSRCGKDAENAEILRETIEAARNAQSLTANLLAFSKGGKPVKKEFCLGKALADIFNLATSGTSAACELRVPEELWGVEGDENQLKQAVNNLLINGLQAMPAGGRLRLEARNLPLGERVPEHLAEGNYVRISVSDTGVGIPAQYLPKVFDPYFTTKTKGHGLGLSMVWSVIKNHAGHIEVSSAPGKGTVFTIYLPATGRAKKAGEEESRPAVKGTGRILVLEDEEVVSNALRRMLKELGYGCEIVTDGREAVRLYAEEAKAGRPFAAVIMDLTIPGGLGGKGAVLKLREIAPGARVVVSSGYSDEAVMADYKANGFDAILPKPYRFEELSETLSRLLKK